MVAELTQRPPVPPAPANQNTAAPQQGPPPCPADTPKPPLHPAAAEQHRARQTCPPGRPRSRGSVALGRASTSVMSGSLGVLETRKRGDQEVEWGRVVRLWVGRGSTPCTPHGRGPRRRPEYFNSESQASGPDGPWQDGLPCRVDRHSLRKTRPAGLEFKSCRPPRAPRRRDQGGPERASGSVSLLPSRHLPPCPAPCPAVLTHSQARVCLGAAWKATVPCCCGTEVPISCVVSRGWDPLPEAAHLQARSPTRAQASHEPCELAQSQVPGTGTRTSLGAVVRQGPSSAQAVRAEI